MIGTVTNHLWQSTLFALATGLLTLAFRQNRAQVRFTNDRKKLAVDA